MGHCRFFSTKKILRDKIVPNCFVIGYFGSVEKNKNWFGYPSHDGQIVSVEIESIMIYSDDNHKVELDLQV